MFSLMRLPNSMIARDPVDDIFDSFNDFPNIFGMNLMKDNSHLETREDGSVEITIPFPGLTKDDLKIDLDGQILSLSVSKHDDRMRSIYRSSYSWRLGQNSDVENIVAKMKNGVLELKISPIKKLEKRTIEIL